jgi:hypothetical protein
MVSNPHRYHRTEVIRIARAVNFIFLRKKRNLTLARKIPQLAGNSYLTLGSGELGDILLLAGGAGVNRVLLQVGGILPLQGGGDTRHMRLTSRSDTRGAA